MSSAMAGSRLALPEVSAVVSPVTASGETMLLVVDAFLVVLFDTSPVNRVLVMSGAELVALSSVASEDALDIEIETSVVKAAVDGVDDTTIVCWCSSKWVALVLMRYSSDGPGCSCCL